MGQLRICIGEGYTTTKYTKEFRRFERSELLLQDIPFRVKHQLQRITRAQVHNYLKATGYRLGLLVNFGHHPKVEWERIVR